MIASTRIKLALPADGSFPSAHATQITTFACAWLLRLTRRSSLLLAVLLMTAVLTVCLSQFYLQLYCPSDVLSNTSASTLWMVALRMLYIDTETAP